MGGGILSLPIAIWEEDSVDSSGPSPLLSAATEAAGSSVLVSFMEIISILGSPSTAKRQKNNQF